MNIPTPGAASELLLVPKEPTDEMLHAGMGAVVREVENGKDGHSYYPLFIYRAMVNAAPPATVMEVAQREAVAEDGRITAWYAVAKVLSEVIPNWLDGAGTGMECAVAAIRQLAASPPSDRVQPERGEPVLDADARVGFTLFRKGIKWSTVIACAQRLQKWWEEKGPVYTGRMGPESNTLNYDAAPPTDGSGGVTVCHCTCHNDPLYCRECKECSCHTK